MSENKKYYFIKRCKKTDKLIDLQIFKTEKTQDEIDEIAKKYNESKEIPTSYAPVQLESTKEIIDLALTWKSNTSLRDIASQLNYIETEILQVNEMITDYIHEKKDK